MVEPAPADPDRQLEELCRVLNHFGVRYVMFGSHVARLNGVDGDVDVDLVPACELENMDRLAGVLNFVRARWRIEAPGHEDHGSLRPATAAATRSPSGW